MPILRAFACGVFPITFAAAQATLSVPGSYPTIQAAIAVAAPADTVLVQPGTYVENIDFLGKAITVRSSAGALLTTIDGNQAGTVVTFRTSEPATAVLEGFTIRNGLGIAAPGGGVQCTGASPTIRACIVTANHGRAGAAGGVGGAGGIHATASAVHLIDCEISGNFGGAGGANAAGNGGNGGAGGAWFAPTAAAPELLRCRFDSNRGGNGGSGAGGSPSLGRGGCGGIEMFTVAASNQLTACALTRNVGGNGGTGSGGVGGFDIYGPPSFVAAPLTLTNCLVVGNRGGNGGTSVGSVGGDGGGTVASGAVRLTAMVSTIAGNSTGTPVAPGQATGGLQVGGWQVSSATLRDCIVWGNTRAGAPSDLYVNGIAALVDHCDIGAGSGTYTGAGNLSVDPLFVNLGGGDVHLSAASPCRHGGEVVGGLPLFDLDGDPRVVGPTIDIGADEWDGLVGTREDFVFDLTVNGGHAPAVVTSVSGVGDQVTLHVGSPGGAFANDFAVLLGEPWFVPVPPNGDPLFPGLQLPVTSTWLAVYGAGVGSSGATCSVLVPRGLAGFAVRLQAVALSPLAHNGLFAATAARDLVF